MSSVVAGEQPLRSFIMSTDYYNYDETQKHEATQVATNPYELTSPYTLPELPPPPPRRQYHALVRLTTTLLVSLLMSACVGIIGYNIGSNHQNTVYRSIPNI